MTVDEDSRRNGFTCEAQQSSNADDGRNEEEIG